VTVVQSTPETIRRAAEILRGGGLVAFPTETVYGLGADARSEVAVERVFVVKGRPRFDPLIVHVSGIDSLDELSPRVDERARRLAAAFWPGPLTLVLPKRESVPGIVSAGLPTVAVRVPRHPVALSLLHEFDGPIAAPSANPFGYLSPTLAEHVERQIGSTVDLVLDGGPSDVGLESTIVDLSVEEPLLLRAGAIETERVEALIGKLARAEESPLPRAPGQLESHYAPRTPLVLLGAPVVCAPPLGGRMGLLRFQARGPAPEGFDVIETLSPGGDVREAASNLFAALHRLDEAGLIAIYAEPVPETGLGIAIVDRLKRAARGTSR
jgi:L-threonylcarbamoyladenylate synthase